MNFTFLLGPTRPEDPLTSFCQPLKATPGCSGYLWHKLGRYSPHSSLLLWASLSMFTAPLAATDVVADLPFAPA